MAKQLSFNNIFSFLQTLLSKFTSLMNRAISGFFYEAQIMMIGLIMVVFLILFLSVFGIVSGRSAITFIEDTFMFIIHLIVASLGVIAVFVISLIDFVNFIVGFFIPAFKVNTHILRGMALENLVALRDAIGSIFFTAVEETAKQIQIIAPEEVRTYVEYACASYGGKCAN